MDSRFDREMDVLDRELTEGLLSQAEYDYAVADLEASFREYAEEVADNARRSVLGEW